MEQWVSASKVAKLLGVHPNTLRRWDADGTVKTKRTPGGHRLYLESSLPTVEEAERTSVCYVRVSSQKQKDDLGRQEQFMRERYPNYEVIRDIGSGLNFKRKGFNALLERVCRGAVEQIVVAHRDRLCRFGFDMFKRICEIHGTELVVLDQTTMSPQQELVADLCSIIHVFSCRIHGLRRYADGIKKDQGLSENIGTKENVDQSL
jgi:predicted site-specific integrase-resolvase